MKNQMFAQRLSKIQWIGLAIVAIALPFELKDPIVSLGPIVITDVEAILYAVIFLWLIGVLYTRRVKWTRMHSAVLAWLIVQILAALFAPLNRGAALKFTLRTAGGVALFFIAADGIRSTRRVAWIMSAVSIGAVVAGSAGLLEIESGTAQTALLIFKTQPTLVGGLVRASGTFQYANTAAMYWEAALPIIITLGVWWSLRFAQRCRLARSVALAGSFIVLEAIVLSASRAALVGAALALTIMILSDRFSRTRSGLTRSSVIGLIGLIVLVGAEFFVNPIFGTRLRSESDDSWFRAEIQPARSELSVPAGEVITETIVVTNTSVQTWSAGGTRPVNVSYHWIDPATQHVLILDGARTTLSRDLAPGEALSIPALVHTPLLTGTYVLQWDLVQENVTWFSQRGNPIAAVNVHVVPAHKAVVDTQRPLAGSLSNTSSPSRSELWRAGLAMWLSHPLLGIGPDNFRHEYGPYLGQTTFDEDITANSWYVELLANTGLIGFVAWLCVMVALAWILQRQWPRLHGPGERVLTIGLSMALLAFFAHGTVDYFMEFTPTYGLFWLIAGTLVGLLTGTHDVEFASTIDRV